MLELDDGRWRLLAHEFDRILIAEPVRSFDGVIHVPAPVVLAHIAERCADASLSRDRVAARRKQFRDTGRGKTRLRQTERRAQPGSTRSNDDDIVRVVEELVGAHATAPSATFKTANTPAMATTICANVESASVTAFAPLP